MPGGRGTNQAGAGWAPWQEEATAHSEGKEGPRVEAQVGTWGPFPGCSSTRFIPVRAQVQHRSLYLMEAIAQSPTKGVLTLHSRGSFHSTVSTASAQPHPGLEPIPPPAPQSLPSAGSAATGAQQVNKCVLMQPSPQASPWGL